MADGPDRVTVSTYVPAYQRDRWRSHAEDLGMSQSEFVRTMVQAGRRGFTLDGDATETAETGSPGTTPRGDDLERAILGVLRERGPLEWDELVDAIVADVEAQLGDALGELQNANEVHHDGPRGGYVPAEDADGE